MTGNPASVSVLALAGYLMCSGFLAAAGPARAQSGGGPGKSTSEALRFDIVAQNLGEAIDAYSRVTGLDVLVDSRHAHTRTGTVRGLYTAPDALQILLAGTGLQVRHSKPTAIVVYAAGPGEGAAVPPPAPAAMPGFDDADPAHRRYAGQLQQALRRALCDDPVTRPGKYRLALQLQLDGAGAVRRFKLLSRTGSAARDAAVRRRVLALAVGAPPPALPQPLLILLLPEGDGAQADCPPPPEH
ncbi:STN domain-containing protein [Janthinobacterium fluminis]|uniref:STN domain-containing protein n=1 Tax=Janthinobacterium fluminis TaxID=2987524 RepID=A0ABT5JUN2_9BURK|nr:STN domain-containing protein [Janthinobacterium fluminis]MDC8756440.1 STN domain-containing protein [Janthinobacterium fluminis]